LSKRTPLHLKQPKAQIEELERLSKYLQSACDGFHESGDPDLGVAMGETARRVSGVVRHIRNRIELKSACCVRRVARGSCDCAAGMP